MERDGLKIAEVRYSWYHAFCYIRSIANRLQETAHIQLQDLPLAASSVCYGKQKATDKTLSIACCTQNVSSDLIVQS